MSILTRRTELVAPVDDASHDMLQVPFTHSNSPQAHKVESFVIFLVFGLCYGFLGYWLVVDQRVVTFDSLDRLSGAYLTWHGVPPKLAAVGFSLPPLQTLVLLPFTIITRMATSLVALPIVSAIFGGLFAVMINRLLDRCDVPRLLRYPALILIGITPTLAFYSSAGGSEMISLALLTAAVSTLIAWFRTVDTRFLISSGVAFAAASMADYGNILWLVLAVLLVTTVLSRHGADDAEVEGSLITYAAPALYCITLWCLTNWLIVKSPFGWISAGQGTTVNVLHNASVHVTIAKAFVTSLRLALDGAPLILAVAPLLIFIAVLQRNELAGWLAAFCVIAIFRPGFEALIHNNLSAAQMTFSAPMMLMAVAGAAWLYQSFPDVRAVIGAALIVGLIATVALVWRGEKVYPYQNMESAFRMAIAHTGEKPTESQGGLSVGIGPEQSMANYVRAHVGETKSVLTDNSQTYAVILFSGEPRLFSTRLDNGQGVWFSKVKNPPKTIKYFLIAKNDSGDLLRDAYQGAAQGHRTGLKLLFQNSRYALLSVKAGTNQRNSKQTTTGGASSGAAKLPQGLVQINTTG